MTKEEKRIILADLKFQYTALMCLGILSQSPTGKVVYVAMAGVIYINMCKYMAIPTFASGGLVHIEEGNEVILKPNI